MENNQKIPNYEILAAHRTHLANERTLLAYIRTSLSLIGFGIIIMRFDTAPDAGELGFGFIVLAGAIIITGIFRFLVFRRKINNA